MKYIRIQRTQLCKSIWILLAVLLASTVNIYAQNDEPALADLHESRTLSQDTQNTIALQLKTVVVLKEGRQNLVSVLKSIADQAGLKLSYSEQFMPLNKNVYIEKTEVTTEEALWHALEDTPFRFGVSASGQLVLLKMLDTPKQSQQETITGTVLDAESGETLPGVNILIKGTTTGTSTNQDGEFELTVPSLQDTLVASFVGYQTREIPLNGRTTLEIELLPETVLGEELVVVGYGTQQRADLTSSISTVDVDQTLASRPITDIGRGLQGAVAGLTVTSPTGDLGTNPDITLRGLQGSLNSSGGASPLILVDGVEVQSLNQINPGDIESISVLKDAASTAIYGSRAAWGAILITTKFGEEGRPPQVNYTNNFSVATPTTELDLAPAAEGAEMAFSALQRDNPSTNVFGVVGMYFDQTAIDRMREWEEQYGGQDLSDEMVMDRDFEIRDGRLFFYRPWDAGDKYMKEWTPTQKHNLSVSGGSENISYNIGLGYLGESGVLKINSDKWERYNVDIGVKSDVNSWLDARGKFIYAQTDFIRPYASNTFSTYDPWYYLYRWPKTYPYGTYDDRPFRSSVTELQQANDSEQTSAMTRVSAGGTIDFAPGLTFDTDFTYTNNDQHRHRTGGEVTAYNFWVGGGDLNYETYSSSSFNNVNYNSWWNKRMNLRSLLTYENDFADHSIKILGGGEAERFEYWSQYSRRDGMLDSNKGEIDLATGDQFVNGSHGHWATLGFFGRINYSFQDKYLIQVNGRMDGSSRFPTDDRWAFFPSVSVGYKISDEPYMDFARPALSFLKIRSSYGAVGNNAVGTYPYISTMGSYNSGWLINDSESQPTFNTPGAVSQSLTWETVTTLDIGMDARLFEDKLSMTFDWYQRTTSNMLSAGITLPASFGTGAPRRNYGELQTEGWELEIGWNHTFNEESHLNITGTLSNFREEITKYANTTQTIPSSIPHYNSSYFTGHVLGNIWGYETDRLFTEDDFQQDASGNLITDEDGDYILKDGIPDQSIFESGSFSYGPGDVKYKDLNGDGVIDFGSNTVDNPGDQRVIGNSTPKYQYGLRIGGGWKGLDASIFIQGVAKREFWADGPIFVPGYRPGEGWFKHQLDYWRPDNPDAFYPRPTNQVQSSDARNFLPQTRYLLDMSYLRMKNVTIGYTLPAEISNQINIQNLRLYVSAENLFEFDNLEIPVDPETDYTSVGLNDPNTFGRHYPFRRILSIGVDLTF